MAPSSHPGTRPYVVTWRGNIAPLRPYHGQLSHHSRAELAITAAQRSRNAIRDLWGAWPPWFVWEVIDSRTGEIIKVVR